MHGFVPLAWRCLGSTEAVVTSTRAMGMARVPPGGGGGGACLLKVDHDGIGLVVRIDDERHERGDEPIFNGFG